tara:strand:+ start:488 stop:1384 length:897 start_codon:yes stop_codon:yes gene_type:complete
MDVWLIILLVIVFVYIAKRGWEAYNHPAHTLGRQAANMDWIACGRRKDSEGYYNVRVKRGECEAEISFVNKNVNLIRPFVAEPFKDFIKVEHWLVKSEVYKQPMDVLNGGGNRSLENIKKSHVNKYKNYHEALDDVVLNLREPLGSILEDQANLDENNTVSLASEMIAYGLACYARQKMQIEIPQMSWNSFKTSVEYRIMPYLSDDFIRSVESKRKSPPSNVFISYTTPAFSYLQKIEHLVLEEKLRTKVGGAIALEVISILGCKVNKEGVEGVEEQIENSLDIFLTYIIPKVQEVFS